jgi:hypothetical protein
VTGFVEADLASAIRRRCKQRRSSARPSERRDLLHALAPDDDHVVLRLRDLVERLELLERLRAAISEMALDGDGVDVARVLVAGAIEAIEEELDLEQAALAARRSGKCPLCPRYGLWSTEFDQHLRSHGVADE